MFGLVVALFAVAMVVYMAVAAHTVSTDADGNLVYGGKTEVQSPATVSTKSGGTGSRATTDEF
jgi:hypothetical protein